MSMTYAQTMHAETVRFRADNMVERVEYKNAICAFSSWIKNNYNTIWIIRSIYRYTVNGQIVQYTNQLFRQCVGPSGTAV